MGRTKNLLYWYLWILSLTLLNFANEIQAQYNLRTLPLTSLKNKSRLGLFSNGPSIENELAAIFRGVAYGVTTESTTTTTTTTTTSTTTTPKTTSTQSTVEEQEIVNSKNGFQEDRTSWRGENDPRPVVKSPEVENEDGYIDYDDEEDSAPKVIKADVGISDIAWIAALGIPWQLHVYITAGLFSLIAILSLICLARVHATPQLLPKGYYVTVHLLVFLASFFRCVFFFHDPYAVSKRLPNGLANLLYNTGVPCIITALAVLVLGLLRSARLKILPHNLQSPIAVAVISGVLVVGSVTVDVIEGFIPQEQLASGLRAGIQALTAGWGSALCIGYIVIFSKIDRAAHRQQIEMLRLSFSRLHLEGTSLPKYIPKCSLSHAARATIIAAIAGLLLAILQVYSLMNTDGIAYIPPRQPWVWFGFQSSCRFLEILMWTCVCIASALPASYSKSKRNHSGSDDSQLLTVFSCNGCCTSCSNISSCCFSDQKYSEDLYSTMCQSNHIARNYGQDGKIIVPQDTITTTRNHQKKISTTLLPSKPKMANKKTSTLNSGSSDVHLLWNTSKSNANSSNSSSRPSSLILTENGLIKFRTHDSRNDNIKIFNYPKHEVSIMPKGTHKTLLPSNRSTDNYINSEALTPEEKRYMEHSITSCNVPKLIDNKLFINDFSYGIKKPSFKSDGNIQNNYEFHVYEDGDQVCYQSPSMDSSMDSNGHLYASVLQPQYQSRHPYQQNKILNNSNAYLSSPMSQRTSTTSPQQDVMATDYLTDGSQDYMSPHNDSSKNFIDIKFASPERHRLSDTSPSHYYSSKPENSDQKINLSNYIHFDRMENPHLKNDDLRVASLANKAVPKTLDDYVRSRTNYRPPQNSPLSMYSPSKSSSNPKNTSSKVSNQREDSFHMQNNLSPQRETYLQQMAAIHNNADEESEYQQTVYETPETHRLLCDRVTAPKDHWTNDSHKFQSFSPTKMLSSRSDGNNDTSLLSEDSDVNAPINNSKGILTDSRFLDNSITDNI